MLSETSSWIELPRLRWANKRQSRSVQTNTKKAISFLLAISHTFQLKWTPTFASKHHRYDPVTLTWSWGNSYELLIQLPHESCRAYRIRCLIFSYFHIYVVKCETHVSGIRFSLSFINSTFKRKFDFRRRLCWFGICEDEIGKIVKIHFQRASSRFILTAFIRLNENDANNFTRFGGICGSLWMFAAARDGKFAAIDNII